MDKAIKFGHEPSVDAAWIVAIAYGPGWQFDCSDHPFSIVPSGVAERNKQVAPGPLPEPTVIGTVLWLGPDLGHDPDSPDGIGSCPASLLDITGRKVLELQPGDNDVRHLAPGVYFVREEGSRGQGLSHPMAPAPRSQSAGPGVRKIVIQR